MRWLVVLAFLLGLCWAEFVRADAPLYEQDPFDQVTLDEANGGAVLKVKPLELPERRVPAKSQPTDTLVLRFVDRPEKKFEVAWGSIKKVELFEEMLLGKANELVAEGQLGEAYGYFRFLGENDPNMAGLAAASEEFLFQQAKAFYGKQQYRNALGVLRDLHRRNPQRPKLDVVIGATTEKLVDQYATGADYPSLRALVRELAAWYPHHPLVEKWETRLQHEAAAQLADARAAFEAGDFRKAAASIRSVIRLWPASSGAMELARTVHAKYPRVVVGVCQPAAGNGGELLTDWAARRSDRLVCRTLAELADADPRGGRYACPVGEIKVAETGRRITVQLHRDLRWPAGEATLSGYDVARRLLDMADPAATSYRPAWARIFEGVAVRDVYEVDVDVRQAHLCPQALLQTALFPYTASQAPQGERLPLGGPYARAEATESEATYLLSPRYFAGTAAQPREIVERRFANTAAAAAALRRGEIEVVDRVAPWQVKTLANDANLVVQSYALPRVHCLIPNLRRPLMANRTFRRALACGIDRQAILAELLYGDRRPGCAVLHGPFPLGDAAEDVLGYASDPETKPWPYDPRLAVVLAEAGRRELAVTPHALVLAFPPDEIARTACLAIRRQLAMIDVPVELRELAVIPTGPIPAEVDLLYVELALWEPLVDAAGVLGEEGLTRGCSAPLGQALRQLAGATRWNEAVAGLHLVDRIARDEVAVVPLWQLTDSFAYRKGLEGIKARTLSLYQDVEQWKPGFQYPSEK